MDRKTLLFIEPSLSSFLYVLKAKNKGYRTLVISSNFSQFLLSDITFNTSSLFFQVDTRNEAAVLDIVEKIAQKFYIQGVIPGTNDYTLLTSKVLAYLNKPGPLPASLLMLQRKGLLHENLKMSRISVPPSKSEEHTLGKEYYVEGFSINTVAYIICISEKLLPLRIGSKERGYIVHSTIETEHLRQLKVYLSDILFALKLNNVPFQAKFKLSSKGPLLIGFKLCLAKGCIPHLIKYATGIDYYDLTFKLLSNEQISFHKTQNLNAGLIFFYSSKNHSNINCDLLLQNHYIKEIKIYDKKDVEFSLLSIEEEKIGHAIFLHKEYEILKKHLEEAKLTNLFL